MTSSHHYHHTNTHDGHGADKMIKCESPTGQERREWHLDKKVSVFVIFGLLANMLTTVGVGAWMASRVFSDIDNLKDSAAEQSMLKEKVWKIEALQDEQGRRLQQLGNVLERMNMTLSNVATEQARRTDVIERMRSQNGQSQH